MSDAVAGEIADPLVAVQRGETLARVDLARRRDGFDARRADNVRTGVTDQTGDQARALMDRPGMKGDSESQVFGKCMRRPVNRPYPFGPLASVTNANGNAVSFAYDGFDRLGTTTHPDTSTESLGYDADSNITTRPTGQGT